MTAKDAFHQTAEVVSGLTDPIKHLFDSLAVGALVAAYLTDWLPRLSLLLTIGWFCLRIAIGIQEYKLNARKLRDRK